jgi:antirestriction protein ArdC
MSKKVQDLLKQLNDKIESIQSSEEFKNLLSFYGKFHNYSYNNVILIYLQKPDATKIAGYRQWQKKFKRHVKKGEKAISILAPLIYKKKKEDSETGELKEVTETYFKPVSVFDISQTEGEPVPEIDISIEDNRGELLNTLEKFVAENNIKLKYKELSKGKSGYSVGGGIVINTSLNDTEKASVLAHELGHELLHQGQRNTSKEVEELEAESIAYVVFEHFGVKLKSDKYLALYKKEYDIKDSLNRISSVANKIIEFIEKQLNKGRAA